MYIKNLLIVLAIMLVSCGKPTDTTQTVQTSNYVYYKITEVYSDSSTISTPVKYVSIGVDSEDGECHDDDDDDDDEDEEHHTLPLKITSFSLVKISSTLVQVNWSAANQDNIDHYVIERSNDTKNWQSILRCGVLSSGNYSITDKPKLK